MMTPPRVPGCIERVPTISMAPDAHYKTPSFWRTPGRVAKSRVGTGRVTGAKFALAQKRVKNA